MRLRPTHATLALLVFTGCAHEAATPTPTSPPAPPPAAAPADTASTTVVAPAPTGVSDANPAPAKPSFAQVPKDLPIGVSALLYAVSVPEGHAPTAELAALGDKLFEDKRLSVDGTVSCSTCHDPKLAFVDHKVTSEGVKKQHGARNSPTVLNAMFNATQFWDGRAATLEDQAKLPILNPVEMGQKSGDDVVAAVKKVPEYVASFQKLFGHDITYDDIAAAIAAFERTQYAGDAPFDRFIQGDEKAIDPSAKRGWALFNGKGRCNECHAGNASAPLFSDQKFHNIGIAAHQESFPQLAREALDVVQAGNEKQVDELALQTKFSELGRFLVTKHTHDVGAFKTPTLRNVAVTGPYMHDGSMVTLWDVIDHYNKGGVPNPYLDGGMQRLGLTEPEVDDLVRFLGTLTSARYTALGASEGAKQAALKGKRPQRDTAAATGKKGDFGDVGVSPDLKVKDPATDGVFGTYPQAGGNAHGH